MYIHCTCTCHSTTSSFYEAIQCSRLTIILACSTTAVARAGTAQLSIHRWYLSSGCTQASFYSETLRCWVGGDQERLAVHLCPARPCCRQVTDAQTSEIRLSGWGGIHVHVCCSHLILYRTLAAYHESVCGGRWVLYSICISLALLQACTHMYISFMAYKCRCTASAQTAPECF